MKTKQWITLFVWFVLYIAALRFFRFRFGILEISAAFLIIGIPTMLLVARPKKTNPN